MSAAPEVLDPPAIDVPAVRSALGCLKIHEIPPDELWQQLSIETRSAWLALAHRGNTDAVSPWRHVDPSVQVSLRLSMRLMMALLAAISADISGPR